MKSAALAALSRGVSRVADWPAREPPEPDHSRWKGGRTDTLMMIGFAVGRLSRYPGARSVWDVVWSGHSGRVVVLGRVWCVAKGAWGAQREGEPPMSATFGCRRDAGLAIIEPAT